jgi:serine/threonine-protein kinase
VDVSPYGVSGMAGNVADWCLTPHLDEPPLQRDAEAPWVSVEEALASPLPARVAKGGAWDDGPAFCHAAVRHRGVAHYRRAGLGFRLAYSVSEAPWAS